MQKTTLNRDFIHNLKVQLRAIKKPLHHNLQKLNEILFLFDDITNSLFKPIKKIKNVFKIKIKSFTGKIENNLNDVQIINSRLNTNNSINQNTNNDSLFLNNSDLNKADIEQEHFNLMNLLDESLHTIITLNKLYNTHEFQKFEEFTLDLISAKKKSKLPSLSLNENETHDCDLTETNKGKIIYFFIILIENLFKHFSKKFYRF